MFKKEYCILNKQYTKSEYEDLIPKIKEHMKEMPYADSSGSEYGYGEFFPSEISPFGYNETVAQDYFPLRKNEAKTAGFTWSEFDMDSSYNISDYDIPDDVKDVGDDILEKVLKCEYSGKAYRIVPMELQFYRRIDLPIPRRSPQQRHKDRIARLLPRELFKRSCDCTGQKSSNDVYTNTAKEHPSHELEKKCPTKIETPFAPDRPEIVYCEECYKNEIL